MSWTLFRYLLGLYLKFFVALFVGVLAIFLIADYGDRVKVFAAAPWADVALLYFNKGLVAAQQLGPAAVLLAGSAAVSTVRKRGELTAMRALSFSPAMLYLPIGLCAFALAALFVVFDERVATQAGAAVDEISVSRFNTWGDWQFYYRPKQWFRKGDRVFYLRSGDAERGFEDVTVLRLDDRFELNARTDAHLMTSAGGTLWRLEGARTRTFEPGSKVSTLLEHEDETVDLGVTPAVFKIRQGRPEQMRVRDLRAQIKARRAIGLPTQQFVLALHNRFAYPLTGFAAALLAVGLALRPGRQGHLTVALVEGFSVAVALWAMMVAGKALALAERLPAAGAAWGPFSVLLLGATVLWLRREGRLGGAGS